MMETLDKNGVPFVENLRWLVRQRHPGAFKMASRAGHITAAVLTVRTFTRIAGGLLAVAAGCPSSCMHAAAEVELD